MVQSACRSRRFQTSRSISWSSIGNGSPNKLPTILSRKTLFIFPVRRYSRQTRNFVFRYVTSPRRSNQRHIARGERLRPLDDFFAVDPDAVDDAETEHDHQ